MVKMVNIMLCIFCHNKKKEKNYSGDLTNGTLTTGYSHAKNQVGSLPHTIYIN